ncbi:MAG TPA: HAD-IA family hydrolase [Gemmatimonadales bacterium]|nr:HAD-IA family hydrolase [Gemmatimonadales bacterium]
MELRCSAFLFDLDGVLVDSRAVVERVCRLWARRHGLDPERVLRIAHGRRSRDTVRAAAPHLDADREAAWIDAVELADVAGLSAVAGAGALLAALPTASWAVVTSCGRPLAERRLTAVGLPIPTVVVTSEEVAHGKPAPDGYQLGAKRLGQDPATCVVFEDAPAGIAAGRAAGARVIGLTTMLAAADLTGADATTPDFTAIRVRQDHEGFVVTTEI